MSRESKVRIIYLLFDLLEKGGKNPTLYDDPENPQIVLEYDESLWRLRASAIEPYYEHDQG